MSRALLLLTVALFAQEGPREVYRVGPGITAPKVVRKQDPGYTRQAYGSRIQGKVVCEVIVDEAGRPTYVSVISPLGYGLDERAVSAVRRWEFKPGMKNGAPVKILMTVEVSFRLHGTWFNDKAERRRSDFNVAMTNLRRRERNLVDQALKTMEDLAGQKYPAAMHVQAVLLITGGLVPKNVDQGLALLHAAAEKNFGPAMSELGVMYVEGKYVSPDVDKGLQMLRDAAVLGSVQAQLFLGMQYESGERVPQELDRARRYFRLCASSGQPVCQFRLAKLMLEAPGRQEWEYLQAVAWAMLAADRGQKDARGLVATEMPKLTPEQVEWTRKLKVQLLRRRS